MSDISHLEEKLDEVSGRIKAYRERLEKNPDDANADVALSSLIDHRNDIQQALHEAKKRRKNEIIEYRLQGEAAHYGGLPLGVLGDLAKELERQIYAAAYYIRDGRQLVSRIPKRLREEINLQLAGLQPGSTKLLVSGDLDPDLFGHSILEDALKGTFALLQAEDSDEVSEHAAEVGSMSAEKLKQFLETVRRNELTIDIEWSSPSEKVYTWQADENELDRITSNLDQIEEEDTRLVEVEGRLTMMDTLGRFKIETNEGDVFECKYPTSLHEKMTNFHLEQQVSASLWRHLIKNSATGHEKISFRLQEIESQKDS